MEINKNNFFAKYYNWFYLGYPNDICSLFWGTLLIVLLFPIAVMGRLVDKYGVTFSKISFGTLIYLGYGASIILGTNIMDGWGYIPVGFFGYFLLAPLIFVSIIAVTFGLAAIVTFTTLKYTEEPHTQSKIVQNTKDWIGAIRQKHCTKIIWK